MTMKEVEKDMAVDYKMNIVPGNDEGGFIVSFPELPGCISIGDTKEEAIKNAIDAKRAWLEAAIESGIIK
ncbi:MAG: type II toxin-antitoxin system HicB family antitoxin [Eubacteriales bacterium]|nr:type II toxin-antitoxin system HicB family antitoxin [Eubacteriales bacterium]